MEPVTPLRPGHASRTAEHNALFRALESSFPEGRRLFVDPLARAFLTPPLSHVARLGAVPGLRERVCSFIDTRWPGVRASVVARTRLIDDTVVASVDERTAQVVILGAGYDTRAHRLPSLRDVTVFEVDHPDTQRAKRRALDKTLPALPPNVRYVATDFNEQPFEAVMAAAGFQDRARTVFLWEGVTHYLSADAVDATLLWCSRAAPGSLLIFTYVHVDVLTNPDRFVGADRLFATLAAAGEKLTFGIEPTRLPGMLADRGLSLERDLGAAEYRELYLGERARSMRGHEFYRVAFARIDGERAEPGSSVRPCGSRTPTS